MLVQMIITGINTCLYVVSRPGKNGSKGCIMYVAAEVVPMAILDDFYNRLFTKLDRVLRIFYSAESVDAVVKGLPQNMPATDTAIIASRWPFF
jgi:hypothetical protein